MLVCSSSRARDGKSHVTRDARMAPLYWYMCTTLPGTAMRTSFPDRMSSPLTASEVGTTSYSPRTVTTSVPATTSCATLVPRPADSLGVGVAWAVVVEWVSRTLSSCVALSRARNSSVRSTLPVPTTTSGKPAADLVAELGEGLKAPTGVTFLPYLSGERTPHNDSAIRATFAGIGIGDGPEALTRAVMEGVSFALRDCLDALQATGARPERLLAIGGGTQSPFWVETLATILGLPLDVPDKGEFGAALGAARLAMAAVLGGTPAELMARPQISHTVEPRADLAASYAEAHARYRALYPNLKAVLT